MFDSEQMCRLGNALRMNNIPLRYLHLTNLLDYDCNCESVTNLENFLWVDNPLITGTTWKNIFSDRPIYAYESLKDVKEFNRCVFSLSRRERPKGLVCNEGYRNYDGMDRITSCSIM